MPFPAPPIDKRSAGDVAAIVEQLLQRYSTWRPLAGATDPGAALVRVFARLAELVIDRLNQAPDRNFLAFLDLVGLELLPPQPARAPLTFYLTTGTTTDATVSSRTQVAAALLESETEPVIFETDRDLVVTHSQLIAVMAREPARDRYSDHTADNVAGGGYALFQGSEPIAHRLYLGHDNLLALDIPKTLRLALGPADPIEPWLAALRWSFQSAAGWMPLLATTSFDGDVPAWFVTLPDVPAIPTSSVAGHTSSWLCAELATSVPYRALERDAAGTLLALSHLELDPDAAAAGQDDGQGSLSLRTDRCFVPFGEQPARPCFYLACAEIFSKPGAEATLDVEVDATRPAGPTADLQLVWEYFDGAAWQTLGVATPSAPGELPATQFADQTQALTQSGMISFRCPPGWSPFFVDGDQDLWLRARIATGSYGTGAAYQPPVIARLHLGYRWAVPRFDALSLSVESARQGLLLEATFANQQPVDSSKDFFPFGEAPKLGDTLYLAQDEAFSRHGAQITLEVAVTSDDANGTPPKAEHGKDLRLVWEFWSAPDGRWETLGESGPAAAAQSNTSFDFDDTTDALIQNGVIRFRVPATIGAVQTNGQSYHWLRVRIAAGDYGKPARYEPLTKIENGRTVPVTFPETDVPIFQFVPARFRPPTIRSTAIRYEFISAFEPFDHVLAENNFVTIDRTAEAAARDDRLFNPFTPAADVEPTLYLGFARPGENVGFANRSTTLFFSLAEAPFRVGSGRPLKEAAAVAWEYWNGTSWSHLGVRDETHSFTRPGLVTFIGPRDFPASFGFGREAFWLRARWYRGDYADPPCARRVLLNTTWASHVLSVQDEVLGSSSGERNQLFHAARAPVLPGQVLLVREVELPPADEQAAIEADEGPGAITVVRDRSGRPAEIWVRWHETPDFFESGPRSRHYVLDRLSGAISFGDGQRGMVPPPERSNIVLARYRTGGGSQGDRAAGTIVELKTTIPYVDRVTNWEPSGGGADQETLEAIRTRGPQTLRHRNRATVLADFEDLATEASTDVARVKGVAARRPAEAGSVALIVVPRSAEARPVPSLELLGRVQDYLAARLLPTVDLRVIGPSWLQVAVSAEIVPQELEAATGVEAAIRARLTSFLHPLTGGLDGGGWEFGRKPFRSDLFALLESLPGVDHVRRLVVDESSDEGDALPEHFLVYSGNHQIVMVGADGA